MTCQWKQCRGQFQDHGEKVIPRYRCWKCGRSPDLEWEEKKAILQALASEKQRWQYAAGQDKDVYRTRERQKRGRDRGGNAPVDDQDTP